MEYNNTDLQGFVVGQMRVISEVIFCDPQSLNPQTMNPWVKGFGFKGLGFKGLGFIASRLYDYSH